MALDLSSLELRQRALNKALDTIDEAIRMAKDIHTGPIGSLAAWLGYSSAERLPGDTARSRVRAELRRLIAMSDPPARESLAAIEAAIRERNAVDEGRATLEKAEAMFWQDLLDEAAALPQKIAAGAEKVGEAAASLIPARVWWLAGAAVVAVAVTLVISVRSR